MKNYYHFDEHSGSDHILLATLKTPVTVESYHFQAKKYPDVYIPNRGLAISLSFKEEDSEEKKNLRKQIEEYNDYLARLEAIPGFLDFFLNKGLCVSRDYNAPES